MMYVIWVENILVDGPIDGERTLKSGYMTETDFVPEKSRAYQWRPDQVEGWVLHYLSRNLYEASEFRIIKV